MHAAAGRDPILTTQRNVRHQNQHGTNFQGQSETPNPVFGPRVALFFAHAPVCAPTVSTFFIFKFLKTFRSDCTETLCSPEGAFGAFWSPFGSQGGL